LLKNPKKFFIFFEKLIMIITLNQKGTFMFKISHLRLFFAGCLLITAILTSVAQEAITLSKATGVFKISNPMQIIDEYSPLFKKIDRVVDTMPADFKKKADKDSKMPSDVAGEVRRYLNDAAINACVDIRGDFYVAMYMDVDAYREYMAEQMSEISAMQEDGMKPVKKNDKEQIAKMLKIYGLKIIIPISDMEKFEKLFNEIKKKEMSDSPVSFTMIDKYAVITFDKEKLKATRIDFDVTFKSKCSIASHSNNPGDEYMDAIQDNMPMMIMPFITPILDFERQMLKEIKSSDAGFGVVNDNIMMETFLTPVPGGKLDAALKAPSSPDAANEALSMLPANMVMASTEIGMGEGYPSGADIINVLLKTIAASGTPAKSASLIKAVKVLQEQTNKGGACGFTLPGETAASTSSMVMIYDVKSETGARDAMTAIVNAFPTFVGGILNGMVANELKLFYRKDAAKINGISTDLYRLIMKGFSQETEMTGKPAAEMVNIEMRVAYVNNKMIIAVGKNSLTVLEAILKGIDAKTTFTTSDAYTGMMAQLPATGVRNVAYISMPGVVKAAIKTFVPGTDKDKILKVLTRVAAPKKSIVGYDEIVGGDDHTVVLYPLDQVDYIINAVTEITKEMEKNKPVNKTVKPTTTKPTLTPGNGKTK
jgi:hypothetical protein